MLRVLPRWALTPSIVFSFSTVSLWLLCSFTRGGDFNDLAHASCILLPALSVVENGTYLPDGGEMRFWA